MAQPWGLSIILLMRKCQRPAYWQISKYYLTGKILSFYMRWSIKAAVWIVKFAFRLALR